MSQPSRAPSANDLPRTARHHLNAGPSRVHYDPYLTRTWRLERAGMMLYLSGRIWSNTDPTVFTHGDYCFPNVTIEDGRAVGFLDLSEVGVADRWRDLAVATWTTVWNIGSGFEDLFLDAYGAQWDLERCAFYRVCYDLES